MDWQSLACFSGAVFAFAIAVSAGCFWERSSTLVCFVLGMALFAVESAMIAFALNSLSHEEILFWEKWILVVGAAFPGVWMLFSALFSRGDKTSLAARRTYSLLMLAVLPALPVFFLLFKLVPVEWLTEQNAETHIGKQLAIWVNAWILISAVLILLNLERTIRASVGVIRWRIKFVILALGILFVTRCYTASQTMLFSSVSFQLQVTNSGGLVFSSMLLGIGLMRMGVRKGVTVYPSHSLLQGSFTFVLAGIYLLIVGVLARAIDYLGGAQSLQIKALLMILALLLLGVALVSDKLRLRMRSFVSDNFSRPIYDYRSVWRRFTQSTGECGTPRELCRAVATLASELFQALSVHVWVFDESKSMAQRVASTASTHLDTVCLNLSSAEVSSIATGLAGKQGPFDLDRLTEAWAGPLARVDSEVFTAGGHRTCCPISSGPDLLGWITLGDRVSGVRFGIQDLDLLKVLAEQAGASLLRLQVSEKLSEAKQFEAFQAMSAFFVHDLKNTASVLTLTLQNFPLHYQDPAFREDALRAMAKTVEHVNDLISRLGALRHELTIQAVECDLNDLINAALSRQPEPCSISKTLGALPRIQVDPEAMDKVISNLLLNAREASGNSGSIEISTNRRNGWVVLDVKDSGCGMTPEFVRDSLFRPFHSTKKRGLGIGMFHCKMIVEAHRGRIEVESVPGKGTCFHILLPANLEKE